MSNYSLDVISNYKENYKSDEIEQFSKYINILNEFIHQVEETLKIKNINYKQFIIIKGIETISHVYKIILLYTKNLDLCFYNSKRALYYYIEFINQIGEENHDFIKLTPKDAILFVYKKTIFSLDENHLKKFKSNKEDFMLTDNFSLLLDINNILFFKEFDKNILINKNLQELFIETLKIGQALINLCKKNKGDVLNNKLKFIKNLINIIPYNKLLLLDIIKKLIKINLNSYNSDLILVEIKKINLESYKKKSLNKIFSNLK